MKLIPKNLLVPIAMGLLCAGSAQATTTNFDFNSDPTGILAFSGSAFWSPSGGVGSSTNGSDGFLSISSAKSQSGTIIFDDFDAGSVVQGFTFECDLRIGNGSSSPADGFSVNYCRANDPVLTGGAFATGPNCEANLPEEGTQTGIGIGFDAWPSGAPASGPFCNEADQSIGPDIRAVTVRVDGTLVLQHPADTQNGACSDPTSVQTGAYDGTGNYASLCWAHLKIVLGTDAKLNVFWKGAQILTDYQTTYFPSPGRLVFSGRCGDLWENQHIDNIQITTIPAALALVGQPTGLPDGFSIGINDSGNSVVDPTTVTAQLNGSPVTVTSATKSGSVTTVFYHGYPTLLAIGSTNTVVISCQDTNHNSITGTQKFVVPSYGSIAASDAVTGVNTSLPGFSILPWQSGAEPNQVFWMLEQLAGLRGANNAAYTTPTPFTGVVNFNITPSFVAGGGEQGNFRTNNGYADALFPGIPGANGLNGSSAINVQCYLQFQNPGVYTMGVNSDDGFLVSEGKNPNDWFANWLGQYNGGKGSSDVLFTFVVPAAGIYPFRLAWENGNGEAGNGANCEWFTVKDGSVKFLINDPSATNTSGVKAFYSGPALPAYVSQINPQFNQTGCRADTLLAQLTDGGTAVNGGSIQLRLDGSLLAPNISKVGGVTTVRANFGLNPMAAGKHTASLVWNDGGPTYSNAWSFTVENWVVLNANLSTPISNVHSNEPGFTVQVTQLDPDIARPGQNDGLANQVDSMDALLGGLYFPWYATNTIDPSGGSWGYFADVTNLIGGKLSYAWYFNAPMDFAVNGSAGDFPYNSKLPGIPGVTGKDSNYGVWFDGYVVFPAAGYYRMGISSDDGFRITEGTGITRQLLHVTGPGGIDTDVAAVATYTNRGSPYGASLPTVPISAPVVYINYGTVCPPPATNVTGKIVVINNFQCADPDYISTVQAGGGVAAILMNDPSYGLPYRLGGTPSVPITIPVLCVNGFGGQEDFWRTNAGLVATIGRDTNLEFGIADTDKGMGWVDFGFVVPQAGAYPIHVTHWNGGGGAGFEWALDNPEPFAVGSIRAIINDSASTESLAAFRTATLPPRFAYPTVFGGTVTLRWSSPAILQSATQLNPSNWTDVTPQPTGNTVTVPATGPAKYYRLR